eukprot:6417250-Alexandrium_andersonii.AAC.1
MRACDRAAVAGACVRAAALRHVLPLEVAQAIFAFLRPGAASISAAQPPMRHSPIGLAGRAPSNTT